MARVSIQGVYITFLLSMTLVIVICVILVSIFYMFFYMVYIIATYHGFIVCDLILVLHTYYVQLILFGSGSLYVGLRIYFYVAVLHDL